MMLDTLTVIFENSLQLEDVPQFRGAVLNNLPQDKDISFHNHVDEGFRYSYPLIQYKVIDGRAAVVFINESITSSGMLMNVCNQRVNIGPRQTVLKVNRIIPQKSEIKIVDVPYRYHISDWLPFNEHNQMLFRNIQTEEQKLELLDRLLVGNILSFAKGVGHFFADEVQCEVSAINPFRLVEAKHVRMMSFDVDFLCNVALPDYIGLGKHASFGFGQIKNIQ